MKLQNLIQRLSKYALLPAITLLAGCASTDYQAVESRGPLVGQGQWGTRKVVDGVDIWTSANEYLLLSGRPDKPGGPS